MFIVYIILLLQIGTIVYLVKQRPAQPKPAKPAARRSMVIDSCGLIDGRITDVLAAGFAPDEVVVPQFIIAELQLLADGRDAHKRERARFGLDVVKQLQASNHCEVVVSNELRDDPQPTDNRLVQLAKSLKAQLYTTDYNLSKVAEIEGVNVLNVNELAQSLRPTALPGERRTIKILEKGSGPDQGVGYLSDGTMVVVNGARKAIGRTVEVEISRTFQTVAGKMLFSSLIDESPKQPANNRPARVSEAPVAPTTRRPNTRPPRTPTRSPEPSAYKSKPRYAKRTAI